jgi:hypothetical protein
MLRHVKIGASINSPVSHRGMAWLPGQGASNFCSESAAVCGVGAEIDMERKNEGRRMKDEPAARKLAEGHDGGAPG